MVFWLGFYREDLALYRQGWSWKDDDRSRDRGALRRD